MWRVLREPALHFVLIGAAIFVAYAHLRPAGARDDAHRIRVTAQTVAMLREEHLRLTGRPPTAEEERTAINQYIDDEVRYREALTLGLDRGDPVVRGRLAQKMEFLAEDTAPPREPTDRELQELVDSDAELREPPAVSIRHVFFSRDRRGENGAHSAAAAALADGHPDAVSSDPFLPGTTFTRRSEQDLDALFGPGFGRELLALPLGQWSGPITSSFGEHDVLVTEHLPGGAPALDQVRDHVRDVWMMRERARASAEAMKRLRARYTIDIEASRP